MATKKKYDQDSVSADRGAAPKRTAKPKRAAAGGAKSGGAKPGGAKPASPRPSSSRTSPRAAGPRIRASHGRTPDQGGGRISDAGAARRARALSVDKGPSLRTRGTAKDGPARGPASRRTPLAAPKRADRGAGRGKGEEAEARKKSAEEGPSSTSRVLALALAAAAIDKKAVGIEILDVTGKVDYADFLLVMTGRSDRHVHAIATGIDEEMRKNKHPPLSLEGLSAATWVLIDFGDVVVHVFQEDARALYDIEGLWMDAGRVPVPETAADGAGAAPRI